jgi:hypothetical protein
MELLDPDRPARRGHAEEVATLGTGNGDPHRHAVALGHDVFHLSVQVGEPSAELLDHALEVLPEVFRFDLVTVNGVGGESLVDYLQVTLVPRLRATPCGPSWTPG